MKGCLDCKYFNVGEINNVKSSCTNNKDAECKIWWANNGKKFRGKDEFDEMECFEPSESAILLESMTKSLDKFILALDKK